MANIEANLPMENITLDSRDRKILRILKNAAKTRLQILDEYRTGDRRANLDYIIAGIQELVKFGFVALNGDLNNENCICEITSRGEEIYSIHQNAFKFVAEKLII